MDPHALKNIIKSKAIFLGLIIILLLGFFLRSYRLVDNPAGFFCDEASIGYNAYSILSSGKDEYGVFFPIFFQSLGDYKSPIEIYSTVPFVAIFGLNELSTRLPSAFFGLITIFLMYLLGKELSPKNPKYLGLLAAFITATMPWLIHYSRIGVEFSVYCAFFTGTVYLFTKAHENKKFIVPAFLLSAITLYTYQPPKLLIPMLLLGILLIYRKTFLSHMRHTIMGVFSFFIISIPLLISFFNGEGFARFNMVSIFSAKLSFTESILHILQNYHIQLSPSYFLIGEPTFITRHFTGGLTPILLITIPFLLIGIVYAASTIKQSKISQILIYWLLIYPVAGAITVDAPFTSRSVIGAPLFALFISLGIAVTIFHAKTFAHKHTLTAIIIGTILLNLSFFTKFYFTQYPLYSADFWGWQYGARDIVRYFQENQSEYDDLVMAPEFNAPEIFFKFYAPHNCSKCQTGFPHDRWNPDRKQLFAITPAYLALHKEFMFQTKKSVYYPDGQTAFEIGTILKSTNDTILK